MNSATLKPANLDIEVHQDRPSLAVADFNKLAPFYRWMEWLTFGPFLTRCRLAFLDDLQSRKSALVLGDGDGRFTAQLLQVNPRIEVEAVDASEAMLRQLERCAGDNAVRLRTNLADARNLNVASDRFDLVATHFFLDCLTTQEVESLAMELRGKVEPGAVWVISEFAIPNTVYGKLVARPLVSVLYLAFRFLTGLSIRRLPDHRKALSNAGFLMAEQRTQLGGLLVSEMWEPVPVSQPAPVSGRTRCRRPRIPLPDQISAAPSGVCIAPP